MIGRTTSGRVATKNDEAYIVINPIKRKMTMYVTTKGDQAIPRSWLVDDCTAIQCPTDVDEDDVEKALREYEEDILKIMEGTDESMAERKTEKIDETQRVCAVF